MRMGMMQPYFFPYLGYFGLIDATDHWIVFDTPQYIRRGWVNRNRVLSTGSAGWKYARIPVASCDSATPIREVRIATRQEWQRELFDSLDAYRLRKAPHYQQTISYLQNTLSLRTQNLSELLVHWLNCCCQRLQQRTRVRPHDREAGLAARDINRVAACAVRDMPLQPGEVTCHAGG